MPLKIALLNIAFPEYTIPLANALAQHRDLSVILISSIGHTLERRQEEDWLSLLDRNVKVKLFRYGRGKNPLNLLRLLISAFQLAVFIRKEKPDILHIQESGDVVVAMAILMANKVPTITTVHDIKSHPGRESFPREYLRRLAVLRSRCVIVHGNYLKHLAVSILKLNANQIEVLPIGAYSIFRDNYLHAADVPQEDETILFFGRMYKYKGLKYLIEAEPIIRAAVPGVKIILAGSGPDMVKYQDTLRERSTFVCYDELIPNAMVAKLFKSASIVVLPYTEASQSGVVAIAFAFGKPVVTTSVGSIPEVVENEVTGLVVPPEDSRALAEALIRLLQNKAMRQSMGAEALNKAKTSLSWDNIALQTIELYKRTLHTAEH